MALFNLTDIKFKKDPDRAPLKAIVDSQYQRDILKYPIDIGTYDKGHYMVIYINEQENTAEEFRRAPRGAEVGEPSVGEPTVLKKSREISRRRGAANASQLAGIAPEKLSEYIDKLPGVDPETRKQIVSKLEGNVFRRIRRTTDAIALYMPDTLNFTYSQSYSDVASFDVLGKIGTIAAAASSIADNLNSFGTAPNQTTNISSFLLQAVRDFNIGGLGNIATLGLAAVGVASNPGLELLYTSPNFRSFRFDFMFYPRSRVEAKQVMKIIKKLKFHQAPEISDKSGGRFLVPPSEFDIQFFYNGTENPNIPKVSTCVLETIDIDYAPNGFSTYEVPGQADPQEGGTGTPTAIRLSLQFKETQIITKEFLRDAKEGGATATAVPNRRSINESSIPPLS
jgi:hypothetical protein